MNKHFEYSTLLTLLLFPLISVAQINYSVKGTVIGSEEYPPAGNVMALNPVDSSLIKGDFFLAGDFILEGLSAKKIVLKLTSLEFADIYIDVIYAENQLIDIGKIKAQESDVSLEEVVITGRRRIYSQKADGTVSILIENTVLAASNSVHEILSKSPDILIDESGSISVFGKGNAILYLNGKRITDNQLALISPTNIKKIEIIRNPSAKYDADGAAVINISTLQNKEDGYQASLKQNSSHSTFAGTDTYSSVDVNYNKGRFSANGNYALQLGNNRHILETTRNREDEAVFLQTDVKTEWLWDMKNYSYYGIGAQYDTDPTSYFSLGYSGYMEDLGGHVLNTNNILDNQSFSKYQSDINLHEKESNNSVSINYSNTIDTLGTNLFVGGQYTHFKIANNNPIEENSIENDIPSNRLLKSIQDLNIKLLSGQADFTKFFRHKGSLEIGAKFSQVENDSEADFLVQSTENSYNLDPNLSNNFNYQESVGAAYLNYKSRIKNGWSYNLGLRSEYTDYELSLAQLDKQEIADSYINLFPNFSLNKTFSNDYNINFAYTAKINRPAYQQLNPGLIYQDPYTSIQGNPESVPQKVHTFELSSRLKQTTFKVGYNHIIDPFGGGAIRGKDDKSYILIRLNFDKKQVFYSALSHTYSNDWWESTTTASIRYTKTEENKLGFAQVAFKPNFYVYTNHRFKVSNLFNVEALFWYLGPNYDGVYNRYKSYNLTLSIDKSFFDNTLKCRFIANDLLHTVRAAGDYNIAETAIYFKRRWNTDYFRLSLIYNFGKLKKGTYKNKAVGKSENDRV